MIFSRFLHLNYIPANFFSECLLCAKTVMVSDSSFISPKIQLDGLRDLKYSISSKRDAHARLHGIVEFRSLRGTLGKTPV